mgnify:CR=1 FL=1
MAKTSIGTLAAQLTLSTGQFTSELRKANTEYQRTIREMKRETGVSFTEIRRSMGGTALDIERAIMERDKALAYDDRDIAEMRTLRRGDVEKALNTKTLEQQAAALGKIAKVFAAVRLGADATRLATAFWKGDLDKARDVLESLPFGMGQLNKMVRELREEWGLMPAYVAKHKQQIADLEKSYSRVKAASDLFLDARKEFRDIAGSARREAFDAMLGTGPQADIEREIQAREAKLRDIDKRLAEERSKQEASGAGTARHNIARLEQEAQIARAEVIRASEARLRNLTATAAQKLNREIADALEERKALEARIQSQELELAGRNLEARELMVKESYRKRLEEADATTRALLMKERDLTIQLMREEAARRAAATESDRVKAARADFMRIVGQQSLPAIDMRALRGNLPPPMTGAQQREDAAARAFERQADRIVQAIEKLREGGNAFVRIK